MSGLAEALAMDRSTLARGLDGVQRRRLISLATAVAVRALASEQLPTPWSRAAGLLELPTFPRVPAR